MRPVVPELVDVEAAVKGPGPCRELEPRDGFLDLKTFPNMRFISLMIDVKKEHLIT